MPDLERTLTRIGAELDWPETPDLAGSVGTRLRAMAAAERPPTAAEAPPAGRAPAGPAAEAEPASADALRARAERRAPRDGLLRRLLPPAGLRRSLALAFALLFLLAGTVFAAVPGVRDAVLEFFGLQGATVEQRESLPPPPPVRPLDLGSRTTLAAARGRLGFEPLVPADPGEPDGVYLRPETPGGELSLTYRPRADLPRARSTRLGLLVTQFRGDLSPELFGKLAGPDAQIERLTLRGRPALWIQGAPHFFFYRAPDGQFVEDELRIAQNVLLLERGRLLVRLEGAFDLERAIEIARSLR